MLDLNFERLESEPGCFVKKGATPKDSIIVVVHVDDLLSVVKREKLDRFFAQLAETLKIKHIQYIENDKPVLSWAITSQSTRTRKLSRVRIRTWTTG